jgi:hypothetical protein
LTKQSYWHCPFVFVVLLFAGTGCGVKGRPQVPDYTPTIGRGLIESDATPSPTPSPSPSPQESTSGGTPALLPVLSPGEKQNESPRPKSRTK